MSKGLGKSRNNQEQQIDTKSITAIFELQFHSDIFFARCQDTGEKPDLQKAKMFKQSFNKINSKKYPQTLNLNTMRLGVNTIMKLIHILETHSFIELNLADNSISEYGMHAIKNLISTTKIEHLNLASNMISEAGLSLILEDFIKNNHIRSLNLGVEEGSIRKNSFGIDGARCLAAILLQNKVLESLKLEDNDIGINGAEIISIPLKKNKQMKELKISQNLIKTQGAEYILLNAIYLQSLDLGKNFIKSSIGPALRKYVEVNKNLKKINLEYNELMAEGAEVFFEGAVHSLLEEINIRGNAIGDRGLAMISNTFKFADVQLDSLRVLNLSANDISSDGISSLISILSYTKITNLKLSKNLLGDDGIIELITNLKESASGEIMEKIDFSGCKMSDKGFMHILESISQLPEIKYLRCSDNYISEKYQKIFADLLNKNTNLIYLNLQGNRLSLSGMKSLKKIVERNLKNYEQREPKKMKSQIYNMKEKQKRIKEAQEKIEKQKREISKLEETKIKLNDNIARLEREERDRRHDFDESIKKKSQQIEALVQNSDNKVETLHQLKQEKERHIELLNQELEKLRQKRKQMEYKLTVAQNQGQMIEKQFEKKIKKMK